MCEQDGRPTEKLINCYRNLAEGGVGLIVSSFTFVRPEGKALTGKMGIHTDDFARDYESLTNAVHDAGGKIAVQLVHAGGKANAKTAGRQPLAPSAVQDDQFPEMPAELTKDEISDIITAFGEGARRAKAWGIDAVQLHGAHGYLINQFLSRTLTAEMMIMVAALKTAAGSCSKCTKRCGTRSVRIFLCLSS
jgi:2,4-dienoyl-CoA reductase-like NADH-dependent reductase (Old Yellow Enzyme family)